MTIQDPSGQPPDATTPSQISLSFSTTESLNPSSRMRTTNNWDDVGAVSVSYATITHLEFQNSYVALFEDGTRTETMNVFPN